MLNLKSKINFYFSWKLYFPKNLEEDKRMYKKRKKSCECRECGGKIKKMRWELFFFPTVGEIKRRKNMILEKEKVKKRLTQIYPNATFMGSFATTFKAKNKFARKKKKNKKSVIRPRK